MIPEHKLIMLDKPVSAIDPLGRREVLTFMDELKPKMIILFTTYILSVDDEISDELLLLHKGKVVESGSLENLREKYESTAIELQFNGSTEQYLPAIEKLQTVETVSVKRQTIHLIVNDIVAARQQLLSLIHKNKWPLMNFSINRASLEDMFMKVVR